MRHHTAAGFAIREANRYALIEGEPAGFHCAGQRGQDGDLDGRCRGKDEFGIESGRFPGIEVPRRHGGDCSGWCIGHNWREKVL
jgi:hypothetical protein